MSLTGFIKGRLSECRSYFQQRRLLAEGQVVEIQRSDWTRSLSDPTGFYEDCFRYFHSRLPADLRAHRDYFARERRGFGEAAFHVMWFLLFREFKPVRFLEIGVYRGQSLSLAALLQRRFGIAGQVAGISPFSPSGDSVSKYDAGLDYQADTLANFAHFGLPVPELVKAYSTDDAAVAAMRRAPWDCLYIDGNHDYEIARADWEHAAANVRDGGLIVLDDAGITTSYQPPAFATRGHPGPSRLAGEIDRRRFAEILQVGHNRVFQRIA